MLREPLPYADWTELPDFLKMTIRQVCFQRQHWQLNNMQRLFRAAVCVEHGWQILGPEIDTQHGHVIADSPVVDVIVRQADQPPASIQSLAELSAQVWAGMTDAEREKHPRIGEVAACADLDGLSL
jgi:hypothetical protein